LIPMVSQFPTGGEDSIIAWILQIAWIVMIVATFIYGQRIQMYMMLREVESSLSRLKLMRNKGRKTAISTIKERGKTEEDPTERVDRFLEYIAIGPVELDPSGIIWRLEHLLNVRDARFKDEVKAMVPKADETQTNNMENMLEAALALNIIYKVIRHFYVLGKKTKSLYIIMQLQMLLPLIMREAEAFSNALQAFTQGQPIGDGVGALVAAKLMRGHRKKNVAKDTLMAKVSIEGRTAYVLKATGPGGNVGKPGEAIKQIVNENKGKIVAAIVIDAAQKLEGEKPGEVAEGIGVAIGGPGVEKYKVEESTLKYKIPVNAVLIKEDIGDAVSVMRKEIFEAADAAIERIKRLLLERTKKGDSVIIAGIGNTIGIGQ